jgi:hypothetical protein
MVDRFSVVDVPLNWFAPPSGLVVPGETVEKGEQCDQEKEVSHNFVSFSSAHRDE